MNTVSIDFPVSLLKANKAIPRCAHNYDSVIVKTVDVCFYLCQWAFSAVPAILFTRK